MSKQLVSELKRETLKSYIAKASDSAADMSRKGGSMAGVSKLGYQHLTSIERLGSAKKRLTGIKNALKRL